MVKLFVGNVSKSATTENLRELFEKYGIVNECDILKNYGFVHMDSEMKAKEAIKALQGYNLCGLTIRVEISNSTAPPGAKGGTGTGPYRRRDDPYERSYPPRSAPYGSRPPPRDPYYRGGYPPHPYDRPAAPRDDRYPPYPYERRPPSPRERAYAAERLPPPPPEGRRPPPEAYYKDRAVRPPPEYYERSAAHAAYDAYSTSYSRYESSLPHPSRRPAPPPEARVPRDHPPHDYDPYATRFPSRTPPAAYPPAPSSRAYYDAHSAINGHASREPVPAKHNYGAQKLDITTMKAEPIYF